MTRVEDLPNMGRLLINLNPKCKAKKWFSKNNNQMGIMVFLLYCIVLYCIVSYGRWLIILTPKCV
jgi:hypothetical protein